MEKAIFPLRKCWESQPMYVGSHIEIKAIDFGWLKDYPNETKLYAPFDGKIVFIDKYEYGQGIAFESLEKVEYADGTIDYMTLWTGHDNDVSNLKVGQVIKQGAYYSDMGTAPNVGKHCHLEVQKGKFVKPTKVTSVKSYKLDNTIEPFKALFLTEDTLLKDSKYQWKLLPKENVILGTPVKRDINTTQIDVLTDILRVRDNPNGNILGYIKKGIYNILNSKKLDDYLWCEVEPNRWVAYSSDWAIFYEKEVKHEQPKEEAKEDTLENTENMPNTEQKYDSDINIPDNTKNVVESEKTIKYGILVELFIKFIKFLQKIFKKGDDK